MYHNPRCSKSRQALTYLLTKNLDMDIVEYLKSPLKNAELNVLYSQLRNTGAVKSAHDMLRVKEKEYKEAKLDKNASDEEVLQAIENFPKLLERPIFVKGNGAAIGRPIENIIAFLES